MALQGGLPNHPLTSSAVGLAVWKVMAGSVLVRGKLQREQKGSTTGNRVSWERNWLQRRAEHRPLIREVTEINLCRKLCRKGVYLLSPALKKMIHHLLLSFHPIPFVAYPPDQQESLSPF
jgi:hypothetical protein